VPVVASQALDLNFKQQQAYRSQARVVLVLDNVVADVVGQFFQCVHRESVRGSHSRVASLCGTPGQQMMRVCPRNAEKFSAAEDVPPHSLAESS
jgi:hypothetical protein